MASPRLRFFPGMLLGLFLALPAWAIAASAPVSALPKAEQALSNTSLAESLELWNQLTRRINHLESENRTWEFRFNPEREERNWWNPFWRSSAERSLQRSNELALQVRDLEKQRTLLEKTLLEESTHYALGRMEHPPLPASPEEAFGNQLDAWRFPIWLKYFGDLKSSTPQLNSLTPELQVRRRQALESALKTVRMLDHYLDWRRTQFPAADPALTRSFQAWQASLQEWARTIEPLLTQE